MKKSILTLTISILFLSCGGKSQKKETDNSPNTETSVGNDLSKIGRENYAIIWKRTTSDEQLVTDNLVTISNELTALWKKGIVENTYYNSDSKVDKFSYFPNISFSLRAESYESAEVILNKLTIVKKGIAVYKIYPIGTLWLDRKHKTIHENGMTKSFATVWTTTGKPTDELTKEQNDKVLELWNAGEIENVYFDIEGTQKPNSKTDFIFYANANTKEEAIAICESLPFFKENIATFKTHSVGVFWTGKHEEN
ncbi:MAG: hypothetical protein P8P13_05485 [Flavobacteriaceae bacterium]|nr:hypothetical protein [Flavobacteriaceae bacterium]